MNIETFQIASGVLASSTVGLGVIAWTLKARWDAAQEHVASLQGYLQDQVNREGALIRKADELVARVNELEAFETRVKTQRINALKVAAAKRSAQALTAEEAEAAARQRTWDALASSPLRPRDEVVASIRSSKTARQVSSAG